MTDLQALTVRLALLEVQVLEIVNISTRHAEETRQLQEMVFSQQLRIAALEKHVAGPFGIFGKDLH